MSRASKRLTCVTMPDTYRYTPVSLHTGIVTHRYRYTLVSLHIGIVTHWYRYTSVSLHIGIGTHTRHTLNSDRMTRNTLTLYSNGWGQVNSPENGLVNCSYCNGTGFLVDGFQCDDCTCGSCGGPKEVCGGCDISDVSSDDESEHSETCEYASD